MSQLFAHVAARGRTGKFLAHQTQWNQSSLVLWFISLITSLLPCFKLLFSDSNSGIWPKSWFFTLIIFDFVEIADKIVICSFEFGDLFFALVE